MGAFRPKMQLIYLDTSNGQSDIDQYEAAQSDIDAIRVRTRQTLINAVSVNPPNTIVILRHAPPICNCLTILRTWPEKFKQVPVIVTLKNNQTDIAAQAINLGARDYFFLNETQSFADQLPTMLQRIRVTKRLEQHKTKSRTDHQAIDSLKRRTYYLLKLNQASQDLNASLDPDEVMQQMMQAATNIIGAKDASIWVWEDANREHLVCRATSNQAIRDYLFQQRIPNGDGIAGWVVDHGESVMVTNTRKDPRFASFIDQGTGIQTKSLLAVPLQWQDDTIGVLEILNKLHGEFDEIDISIAEALARSSAIAIENAHLVDALRKKTFELSARNEELDAFAHTVAHDLKTPLIWINGFTELLISDNAILSAEERQEYLASVQNGALKMESIIDELLLLASLRNASVIVDRVPMLTTVHEACSRLKHMIRDRNAKIKIPSELPDAYGYGPWIEGVWVNYISNAIKYGGTPPEIEIGVYEKEDDTVCYWVMDNGKGLTKEEQERLFVPFHRLEQQRASGHGLGLSIVQRIIEKLGGEVSVESVQDRGSCFMFSLPSIPLN